MLSVRSLLFAVLAGNCRTLGASKPTPDNLLLAVVVVASVVVVEEVASKVLEIMVDVVGVAGIEVVASRSLMLISISLSLRRCGGVGLEFFEVQAEH